MLTATRQGCNVKNQTHERIRNLLRYTGGSTTGEIAKELAMKQTVVSSVLPEMPDAYVDRWKRQVLDDGTVMQRWISVWCVIDKPKNCPRPDE